MSVGVTPPSAPTGEHRPPPPLRSQDLCGPNLGWIWATTIIPLHWQTMNSRRALRPLRALKRHPGHTKTDTAAMLQHHVRPNRLPLRCRWIRLQTKTSRKITSTPPSCTFLPPRRKMHRRRGSAMTSLNDGHANSCLTGATEITLLGHTAVLTARCDPIPACSVRPHRCPHGRYRDDCDLAPACSVRPHRCPHGHHRDQCDLTPVCSVRPHRCPHGRQRDNLAVSTAAFAAH
jgi:hypothetical protein